jgi:lipooligosaccharide transport system permease protein
MAATPTVSTGRAQLTWRVLPPLTFQGRGPLRIYERNTIYYRSAWKIVFSGFFEPVFYLFSLGVGLDRLVDGATWQGHPVDYTAFVAPALLASSAMNGAVYESTMNVFFKLKYGKLYDAMLATPLQVGDVTVGEISWCLSRGAIYAAGFLIVMLVMGLIASPWAVLALPAAVLVGFGFAAVGFATTSFMRSWEDFDLVLLVSLPLFLFSATFYPLSVYPPAVQWFIRATPLYHGVELMRTLTLGGVGWGTLVHVAYFLVMGAIGLAVANRRLHSLLLP